MLRCIRTALIAFVFTARLALATGASGINLGCFEAAINGKTPARAAAQALNESMARKYPGLKFILQDPAEFFKKMDDRFEAQRKITPDDPYQFDFSEIGIPLLRDMKAQAQRRILELETSLASNSLSQRDRSDMQISLQFLRDLSSDFDVPLKEAKISYRRIQQLGFFFSRVYGRFDARKQGWVLRASLFVDDILNGYSELSMKGEYQRYLDHRFSVFVGTTPVKAFRVSKDAYENTFFDKEKLHAISFPTNEAIGRDTFYPLMPYGIYPIGVTDVPIEADGVLRPSDRFWNHDIRHSSNLYYELSLYREKHHLSDAQFQMLRDRSAEWYTEVADAIVAIPDQNMREAVELVMFNFHHERGFLIVPSSYLQPKVGNAMYGLYRMMKINQEIPLGTHYDLDGAYQWLRNYWLPKLPVEEQILGQKLH